MLYCTPDRFSITPHFYCCFYYWTVHVDFVQILPMHFFYTVFLKATYQVNDFSSVCVNFIA